MISQAEYNNEQSYTRHNRSGPTVVVVLAKDDLHIVWSYSFTIDSETSWSFRR